jgi:conjugal transfer mating pair stabilization protein TraG
LFETLFEIYAYGNVDTLTGVFNAIAAIMGGADYLGLLRAVAITGVLVAAFAGLFTPGRFHGWGWLIGFLLVYQAAFLPKATVVVVDKLGSQTPAAIDNVPLGLAFFGHATSLIGHTLTGFFETAFQTIPDAGAQLPEALAYQKNGVMFGNRLIQASRSVNVADPQLRTDLIGFVQNCTAYDLQDGTINPAVFSQSTDLWSLMGSPNPARFTAYGSPAQVGTCPDAYAYLAQRLPAAVASARAVLAMQLNPTLNATSALGSIDTQIEQAYLKTRIASAAQGAGDLLRQNILINLVQDAGSVASQRLNDPAALMLATARAQATASANTAFLTMGKLAEQALPLVRNVIEAVVYAVFPFVLLVLLLAQGKGLAMGIRSFAMGLVWIQLWPPLYAILNYVGTLASARNLEAAAKMGASLQGLALETAARIHHGAVSDQAVAGYMVLTIPAIAAALVKGAEAGFQAVAATGVLQGAATSEGAAASKGLISQNSVQFDQQQLAPNRTSAFMGTTADAHGTTIQGIGADASVFRYQATMSRLPTTFTISERQAQSVADSARTAETQAKTEREAFQRSQSTALTQAMALQESYERSEQRSGDTSVTEGGARSTQIQTLNGVARNVNRQLGLREESTVGKTIVASASAGLTIPMTEIGARAQAEGRTLDQQALSSVYDYARGAMKSTQVSDASSLTREFRNSDAYQWARSSRAAATSGFDSSFRDASERQETSERATSQAQELARTAQFMREWSSGAQTDFTNYAAARLAERGLLREEDPARMQRTVMDIAMGYARGGSVSERYVPADSPLPPSPVGNSWPVEAPSPGSDWQAPNQHQAGDALADQRRLHDATVQQARDAAGVGSQRLPIDRSPQSNARTQRESVRVAVEGQKSEVAQIQQSLNQDYNQHVTVTNTRKDHGGNPAVWSTVGADAANRADVGSKGGSDQAKP